MLITFTFIDSGPVLSIQRNQPNSACFHSAPMTLQVFCHSPLMFLVVRLSSGYIFIHNYLEKTIACSCFIRNIIIIFKNANIEQ